MTEQQKSYAHSMQRYLTEMEILNDAISERELRRQLSEHIIAMRLELIERGVDAVSYDEVPG